MDSQFIDITWLKTFGLFSVNALEYFYTSPFYDINSNNQIVRTQGVSVSHLITMTGLEYNLDESLSKEPHLFVIKKVNRISPKSTELLKIFYIIDGIIYQSPFFLDVLRNRISKISHHLNEVFNELKEIITYSSVDGPVFAIPTKQRTDIDINKLGENQMNPVQSTKTVFKELISNDDFL